MIPFTTVADENAFKSRADLEQELSDAMDRIDNQECGMTSMRSELHQCDTKLKDALVLIEELRAWKKAALEILNGACLFYPDVRDSSTRHKRELPRGK